MFSWSFIRVLKSFVFSLKHRVCGPSSCAFFLPSYQKKKEKKDTNTGITITTDIYHKEYNK